jgi:hypothetical protein
MLRNTLILPADNAQLAAKLLRDAIADLDVVLMLVLGTSDSAERAVGFADQLSNKTRLETGGNLRRVVWVHDPQALAQREEFRKLFTDILDESGGQLPLVAVLNFHDLVKGAIEPGEPANPTALELMFLRGQGT